jgi:hypothetical protein
MMMRTRRLLTTALLTALIAVAMAGGAQAFWGDKDKDTVKGSGDAETRTLELSDFDRVDVGGAFTVNVTRGDEHQVTVTIDDNLWELLEAEVKNGKLTFDWKKSIEPDVDSTIDIVAPTLTELSTHGAADVTIRDFKGNRFEFGVSGAGELEMDGEVDELEIGVSGAGDIDTRDLEAKHVTISVSGAGEAKVHATESFDGRVSGVGNITCYGSPEKQKTRVSGMGDIEIK